MYYYLFHTINLRSIYIFYIFKNSLYIFTIIEFSLYILIFRSHLLLSIFFFIFKKAYKNFTINIFCPAFRFSVWRFQRIRLLEIIIDRLFLPFVAIASNNPTCRWNSRSDPRESRPGVQFFVRPALRRARLKQMQIR